MNKYPGTYIFQGRKKDTLCIILLILLIETETFVSWRGYVKFIMTFIKNYHCSIPDRYLIFVRINQLRNSFLKKRYAEHVQKNHYLFSTSISKLNNITTYCIWKNEM